ncbi:aminotransferase class I/II-fold pyridoxal phosphate-dependent enzyme [Alkalibacterium pelagium]|uniref:DNA-binding transcriptional regulator, MocR family, contains an aminotransferase domain n=1 Tax=Alkalibacterium pelagium TaxID=426702 RepID=A0A1H7KVT3_9LACT|nr:aminotransferase class I/II-fold pyridoxal phosphate-dependent enzyme [Alkalibacterium pelagium]GEN50666.1 aminotransferase [Alkalibacterium pelagium]SEK90852.1 DNA-binding transcriptional regulator, MocR family, contains an aminotransferase domain [Alkalibacterium pelagium]
MSIEEISERLEQLRSQYALYKNRPFDITIARGIPSTEQLKLSEALLNETRIENWYSEDELDIRNYGGLFGLKEARELFGELLNTQVEETFVGGNSSLQMMYATLVHFMFTAKNPWSRGDKVKFICPSPGYDRHWFMLDHLGIEMIPVELTGQGPDMEAVEKLVAQDPAIKGMFVVPTYNNPTGETISDESVTRLANMFTAYEDFIILWDNAYVVHHLTDDKKEAADLLKACKEAGNENRVIQYVSTSKMTLPGSGVAAMGASEARINELALEFSKQIISFDKINQMRHVLFLKDRETIEHHMEKHAEILSPKFDWVDAILSAYFSGDRSAFVQWTKPEGGYFIHLTTQDGCATDIVEKMKAIGIELTPANAAYPYGVNPKDNSIRLAPSFAKLDDLEIAMEALCTCIELVSLEKSLTN